MLVYRVMKGAADNIPLQDTAETQATLWGGIDKSLAIVDNHVIIGADDLRDFPVPKERFGELLCELIVGNESYHVIIAADPERPDL